MSCEDPCALFVTANVGSIFEEPTTSLKIWTEEFLSTISRLDPKFIALHCQEVGGKNYEKSMQHVDFFVKILVESEELRLFDKVRVYLDEDFSSSDKFTALGNFYFIHESINDVLIYDFQLRKFQPVEGKEIHPGNIEEVPTKEKSKFPLEYFPECKWSRKGFLRTRWSINSTIFDLVNIHLFHDASNFVAIESYPSVYSDTRRRALQYTLQRFVKDEHVYVPMFIFGDFNFRTDTKGVVEKLSDGLEENKIKKTDDSKVQKIEFKDNEGLVLSLGKKLFSHSKHQEVFASQDGWLRQFDRELNNFEDSLFEFDIAFPPTYPFEEDNTGDKCYMKTRCPAWCDRILLTHPTRHLVKHAEKEGSVEYGLLGQSTCMGDHKPVYLKFTLATTSGIPSEMPDFDIKPKIKFEMSANILPIKIQGSAYYNVLKFKRVNSESKVETKKEDWKNARCNSDVTQKTFNKTNSRIRLISSSNSLNISLPRLTSHHSSSDEEWFEEVDEIENIDIETKRDSLNLENTSQMKSQSSIKTLKQKLPLFNKIKSINKRDVEADNEEKWDTIDLRKNIEDIQIKSNDRKFCCILQ